jgi:hypothetical protein
LLDVDIDLTPDPPAEWARGFEHPVGVGISMSMHPPVLSGATVHIRPPDNELEKYVAHVDERIAAANAYYEREVLPALDRAEAEERQHQEDEQKRIDDAKRLADNL